jgi:hypothetical protein
MTASMPVIAIDGSASGGGGSSTVNDLPGSIGQSWAQLIASGSDFFQRTGAKIFNMDAGSISMASPAQLGRNINGVIITAAMIQRNQQLLNAIGAYCRANGISVHIEAQLNNPPAQDWTYQWLEPARQANLPITGVENDDEVELSASPTNFASVAQYMVGIVQQITKYYPGVQIGQWEGGSPATATEAWWTAYNSAAKAAGLPLISYAVADTSWNAPWVTSSSDWQGWLTALSNLAKQSGVQLEVLLDGIKTDASDSQWTAQSEQHGAMLATLGGVSADVILIRSWQTNYPQAVLPVNSPTTLGNDVIAIAATYPLYKGGLITAQGAISLSAPSQVIARLGSGTAIGPVSMNSYSSGSIAGARVAAVLLTETGVLTAATSGTGSVSGTGSNELILNGTYDEVAAELRTVTVTGTASGPDTIDIELFGANGRLATSQIPVLFLPSPPGASPQVYSFQPTAIGQAWTSSSVVVDNGVMISEAYSWNATDQNPTTGAYQIIKAVGILEPLAESGVTIIDGVPQQSFTSRTPLNGSSWNASAFNPAGCLSSVNVLSTRTTYGPVSGRLWTKADNLAPTNPTATITNGVLPNYFGQGGMQVIQFNTGDNPNWAPSWGSWLGSVVTTTDSGGVTIQQEFQGGSADPYFNLKYVFDPYSGALWEQIVTGPPPDQFGTFVTGVEYISEYNTGNNPNWDYVDWGESAGVTELWQDYYLVNVTVTPPPPTTAHLVSSADSGMSNTDNITNVTNPMFTGMAEIGNTVTLYDGTRVIGTGVATTGTWTITAATMAAGTHGITAKAADAAGIVSAASGALSITIDNTAPAIPSAADLIAASDTGVSSTDNITNIANPTFTGAAEAGSTVTLFDGTTVIGAGMATAGTWTITSATLAAGTHGISATATDPAGNTSGVSNPLTIVTLPAVLPAVTTGTGSDTLILNLSEDAYQGDAQFTVSVDGKQLGGTFTTTASHAVGTSQAFTFKGDWAIGMHGVTVNFLNDAWAGTPLTDRNLYVNTISYDGTSTGQSAALMSGGPKSFTVSDTTAIPAAVSTGSGSDTLILNLSEDAYQGDAQFTVSVDGKQLGGTFTTTASHAAGASQAFTFKGDWATGMRSVTVNFLNDAWAGTPATDRNLYVNAISYDGTNAGQSAALMNSGPKSFPVTDTTVIPSPAVTGSGSDTLILNLSEDAYQGDAQFTVSVDSKQLGGTFTATASHAAGASQAFTFKGDWAIGMHSVTVNFLNDAWAGTPATDRNLYVDTISYDGTNTGQSATLMSAGPKSLTVTDTTAIPAAVTGSGSDTLVLGISEDAYQGDAQFTVLVDGKQLGGTFTASSMHAASASQNFVFDGDFGSGQHTVTVNFLNDAWAGTPTTDRNLYVNAITYNGTNTNQSAALMSQGPKTFAVSGGTTPAVSETSDHGTLQQNLAQTGTYTVGGDTFVLSSGNAAIVTLGAGASQIRFTGASSVALTAGAGQAVVNADAGTNTFVAGSGSLDVTGGDGQDAYVFHAGSGLLTIEDFALAKGDTLTVDMAFQGSLSQASDGRGGTMLNFGTPGHGVDIHGIVALPSDGIVWA